MCASPLQQSVDAWREINAPETVCNWISNGIDIPFNNLPTEFCIPNKCFSVKESQFLSSEIDRLVSDGVLIECINSKPICISPISCVPKKNNKLRLIVDLRYLNEHITPKSFHYEGIKVIEDIVKPNDKLVTIDIKDGFHHIPVSLDSQKYLGIQFNGKFYKWTKLPFGLKVSPYFFCKTIRPIISYFRSLGVRITVYVDDFLLSADSVDICSSRDFVLSVFENLGIRTNFEKSNLEPKTRTEYIGYVIDTVNLDNNVWIFIPKKRITKLRHSIKLTLRKGTVSAKGLARIAGQCVSMSRAVLPGKLLLRNIYRLLKQRLSWQDNLTLDEGTIQDLQWWEKALLSWNGTKVVHQAIDLQLITDASSTGWGAVLEQKEARGLWNQEMSLEHSNVREMMAVLLALKSFRSQVHNKVVQLLSDNISTVAYINYQGGSSVRLTQLATAIWAELIDNKVSLVAKHIAGSQNVHSDFLSRLESHSDWKMNTGLFQYLDRVWGPHTIDRCASFLTKQIPCYNSLFYDPFTSGIDCLGQRDWWQHNNFVNPPFKIIPHVLRVIIDQSAEATVIAPWWPGKPWLQTLRRLSVCPPIRLKNNTKTFMTINVLPEPLKNRRWKIYAWRISGAID